MQTQNSTIVNIINGRGFYFGILLVIGLFFVIGIAINMNASGIFYYVSFLMILSPTVPIFSHWGSLIDPELNRIKQYNSFYGIKFGEWKSMDRYTDIVIQTLHYKKHMGSQNDAFELSTFGVLTPDITLETKKTSVFIMTPDHRRKLLVAVGKDIHDALRLAYELHDLTGKEMKRFNPKISEATKARRYH